MDSENKITTTPVVNAHIDNEAFEILLGIAQNCIKWNEPTINEESFRKQIDGRLTIELK